MSVSMESKTKDNSTGGYPILRNFFDYPAEKYTVKFGFKRQDGTYVCTVGGCHGYLNNLDIFFDRNNLPTHFISCLRTTSDKGVAEKYWDKVFDLNGPFKDVLKGLEFYKDSSGNLMAFSVEVDKDTSTQLLASMAIATRMPFEHPYRLMPIMKEFGDLPSAEFLFVLTTLAAHNDTKKKSFAFTTGNPGHYPFDFNLSLKKLKDAAPSIDKGQTIGNLSAYTPNNIIWNENTANFNSLKALVSSSKSQKRNLLFQKLESLVIKGNDLVIVSAEETRKALANA